MVLWDTNRNFPVFMYSSLVKPDNDESIVLSKEIEEITGIKTDFLRKYAVDDGSAALQVLDNLMRSSSAVVAHNGRSFDLPIIKNEMRRMGIEPPTTPIVDTKTDIRYPSKIKSRSLTHLAAEHGFLNPFPHRALSDVLTMLNVLSFYDFDEVFRRSKSPDVTLLAKVSFAQKHLAKEAGFHWNSDSRRWTLDAKQCDLEELDFPFDAVVLSNEVTL